MNRKNEVTGEITLKPKGSEDQRKRNLEELFRLIAENPFAEDLYPSVSLKSLATLLKSGLNPHPQKRARRDSVTAGNQHPRLLYQRCQPCVDATRAINRPDADDL